MTLKPKNALYVNLFFHCTILRFFLFIQLSCWTVFSALPISKLEWWILQQQDWIIQVSPWHKIGVNYCLVLFYDHHRIILLWHWNTGPGETSARKLWRLRRLLSRQLATILNFLSHKIWCNKLLWPWYRPDEASISIFRQCQQFGDQGRGPNT